MCELRWRQRHTGQAKQIVLLSQNVGGKRFSESSTYTSVAKVNRLFGQLNNFSFTIIVNTIDVLGRVENAQTTSGFISRIFPKKVKKTAKIFYRLFQSLTFFYFHSLCMRQKQSTRFVLFRPCSFAHFFRITLHRDGLVTTAECT